METLVSQNEHVPEHIKDTLVTPEMLVAHSEGLLDLVKNM